jgi:hypothetical protein
VGDARVPARRTLGGRQRRSPGSSGAADAVAAAGLRRRARARRAHGAAGLPRGRLTVPRQSGKTTLLLVLILLRALGAARQNIRYTAQTGSDARKKWMDDWLPALDASSFARFYRPRLTNGHEALRFTNGSLQGLVATTQKSGHGGTLDLGILDEAFAHPDARLEQALKPAMITRPQPQLWVVSTAGTPGSEPVPVGQGRRRAAGWSRRAARTPSPTSSGRAADELDPADPDTWWSCMPALGHTVTEEAVASDFASMELGEFERAYLNRWHAPANEPVVPLAVWAALVDAASTPRDPVCLAFDVSPDGRSAAIVAGGSREDGLQHVEVVDHRDGTGWLEDRIVGARGAKHYPRRDRRATAAGRPRRSSRSSRTAVCGSRRSTRRSTRRRARALWTRRRPRRSDTAGSPCCWMH